jgi:DNA-binding transcriptional regulator YiaG
MKKKACPECGGNMTQKNPIIAVRVADKRVKDGSMSLPTCDECGYYELSQAELEKMERRAAITVLNGVDGPSGGVLKFARKALGLRQADLARALGTASETVSRWEANERIDRTVSLAVAHLLATSQACIRHRQHDGRSAPRRRRGLSGRLGHLSRDEVVVRWSPNTLGHEQRC